MTYEDEVSAYRLCIQESAATPEGQSMSKPCSRAQWLQQSKEAEAKAVQMCKTAKDQDVGSKIAALKAITKGAQTPFSFEDGAPEQPRRCTSRGARSR